MVLSGTHGQFSQHPDQAHPKRRLLQLSASSRVLKLRLAGTGCDSAKPPARLRLTPALTQEAQTPFVPDVESGRGAFWEVSCRGAVLRSPRLARAFLASRLHSASEKLRWMCIRAFPAGDAAASLERRMGESWDAPLHAAGGRSR